MERSNKQIQEDSILFDDITVLSDVKTAQKQSAGMEDSRYEADDYVMAPVDANVALQNQRERDILAASVISHNTTSISGEDSKSAEFMGIDSSTVSYESQDAVISYEQSELKTLDTPQYQSTELQSSSTNYSFNQFVVSTVSPQQAEIDVQQDPLFFSPNVVAQTSPVIPPNSDTPLTQVTEAPTAAPTEPVTEAPTEPVTEAPTEYYITSEKKYIDVDVLTKTTTETSFVEVTIEKPVVVVTEHTREVVLEVSPETTVTKIVQQTYTETETVDVIVQKLVTEEKTVVDEGSMSFDSYDADSGKYFRTDTHKETVNQPREKTITEYRTEIQSYVESNDVLVDVEVTKTRTIESVDTTALSALGIIQAPDGNYYKVDETKPKIQTTVTKYKETTFVEEAEPIMKTATETTVVPTLGNEYSSGSVSIPKKSSKTVIFDAETKNIEIDFTSFNTGTVKISFVDASGDQVGSAINQSHVNDSRGYAVPDGAVGVKIENLSTTTPVTIGDIQYRGPIVNTVVEDGGLVPDTGAMTSAGITWQDSAAIHKEQTSDINNIGNIGDSNVKGFNPEDSETSNVFSFGSDLANQKVSITLDYTVKGTWDFNEISTKDIFTVSANGSPIETYNYTDNQTDYNKAASLGQSVEKISTTGTSFVQSYDVFLDDQGNLQLDFMVASTADSEIVNVTNIAVDYNGYTGYVKETTVTTPYDETVFIDAVADLVPYEDLPKIYAQEDYTEIEQIIETVDVVKTREVEVPYEVTVTVYDQVEIEVNETVEVSPVYKTVIEEKTIDVVEQQEVTVEKTRDVEVLEVVPAVFETITETYTTEETAIVEETHQEEVITTNTEIDQSIVSMFGAVQDDNGWYFSIDTLHLNESFQYSSSTVTTETGTQFSISGIDVVTNGESDLFVFGDSSILSADWASTIDPSSSLPLDVSAVSVDIAYSNHTVIELQDTSNLSW